MSINSNLQRQLQINNSIIDRLLSLIEQRQRENTTIIGMLSRPENRQENREETEALDIIFYSYYPRNTDQPGQVPTGQVPTEQSIPTMEVIGMETSNHIFKNIENPKNLSCPIIVERFLPEQTIVMINHCGHLFTPVELRRWFETHSTCPVCRHDICSITQDTDQEVPENHESINFIDNFISRITNSRISNTGDLINRIQTDRSINNFINILREEGTLNNIINGFRDI